MDGTKDTLWNWLSLRAQEAPDRAAIIGPDATVSYGELEQRVRAAAGGLQKLGLEKGDIVAVQLPNIDAFVVAFLAVYRLRRRGADIAHAVSPGRTSAPSRAQPRAYGDRSLRLQGPVSGKRNAGHAPLASRSRNGYRGWRTSRGHRAVLAACRG